MDARRAQPGGQRDLTDGEPLLMGGHDGPDPLLLGRAQAFGGALQPFPESACVLHALAKSLRCLHSCHDTRPPTHLSSKLNGLTPLSVPLLVLPQTDQEGAGRTVGIPYGSKPATCPVRAVRAWLTTTGITDGPLFRGVDPHRNLGRERLSDKTVARVVKNAAEAAGFDPVKYAGHSLRAGLATAAAQAGIAERVIMAQTGHKSLPMVRKYIREGSLFTQNAAAEVGL